MINTEDSTHKDENFRPLSEYLFSRFAASKREDVVFFRMDTPSQLEKEYEFGSVLGEGTFGIVYRGIRKKDNAKCAIKKISRERAFSASERARLDREISILRMVRHPGIIELFAVAESPSILFLIMELCEGSSLSHCLYKLPENTGVEEHVVVELLRQITAALSYLHNRGIVHRDLKPCNIMLLHKVNLAYRKLPSQTTPLKANQIEKGAATHPDTYQKHDNIRSVPVITDVELTQAARIQRARVARRTKPVRGTTKHPVSASAVVKQSSEDRGPQAHPSAPSPIPANPVSRFAYGPPTALIRTKIIDFGLAIEVRKNEEPLDNPCGTPLYMAPEVLSGRSYTRQCDVWSLGIMAYQLLTRSLPFTAQNEEELLDQMTSSVIESRIKSLHYVTQLAQTCLLRILHLDPAYRYSASELLLDPWICKFSASSQEDVISDTNYHRQSSLDGPLERSARASSITLHLETASIKGAAGPATSRPPSIGMGHSVSTYSATNVLELMKQFHKELASSRTEVNLKKKSTENSDARE